MDTFVLNCIFHNPFWWLKCAFLLSSSHQSSWSLWPGDPHTHADTRSPQLWCWSRTEAGQRSRGDPKMHRQIIIDTQPDMIFFFMYLDNYVYYLFIIYLYYLLLACVLLPTFSDWRMLNGKQPHCSKLFSTKALVVQFSKDSTVWHPLISFSRPRKESVTRISLTTFKLYSPSPNSLSGSIKTWF